MKNDREILEIRFHRPTERTDNFKPILLYHHMNFRLTFRFLYHGCG